MAEQQMPGPGMFGWNELTTHDVDQAKAFYAAVGGWTFEDMPMPDGSGGTYTIAKAGGQNAGGLFRMQGPQFDGVPPHWTAYLTVADVDAAVQAVEANGGKVLMPAMSMAGVGRFAVVADPAGATFGIATWEPMG